MKCTFWKKFLLIMPAVILAGTLAFVNYTMKYFREMSYTFVYDTNVGSVQRFCKEVKELRSAGYDEENYSELYENMIWVYCKTLGEKKSIFTFLLDENKEIQHSTTGNERYLSVFLKDKVNQDMIYSTIGSTESGEVLLKHQNDEITMYYQKIANGNDTYHLFMGIDRRSVDADLNADKILIPISIIGLILLFLTEYAVWLRIICLPQIAQQKGGKSHAD